GPGVSRWKIGDRVFGLTPGGAHAEFVAEHEGKLAAVPAGLSWAEAASVPEAFITAHDALRQAGAKAAGSVLIHAVGSGVGLAAVQLVRALGATPFGTSRTLDKIERARDYGLKDGVVLDAKLALADFTTQVTGERGFDVVLDLVGGAYVAASVRALGS